MKKIVLFIAFFFLLTAPALAAAEASEEARAVYGVSELEESAPGQVSEILGDYSVTDGANAQGALAKIWDYVSDKLGGILKSGLKSAALILIIVMLCSLTGTMGEGGTPDAVVLGGAICVSAVSVGDVGAFVGLGRETLQTLSDFSTLLLPSLATAAAAGGALTSAAAKYAATALFMNALLSLAQGLILPLIYAYITAVIANAAIGGDALSAVAGLLKWLCVSLLSALVIAFVAYLSFTGVVSGSADAVTTRMAKTTLSTVLPVVGSIISDAAGTVVAGAGLIRNAVGVFGMLAVLCVCCVPFMRVGVHYLLYKAAAGLSAALSGTRLPKLIAGIGSAFGMVMALMGAGALMLFFSIFSLIKAVSWT